MCISSDLMGDENDAAFLHLTVGLADVREQRKSQHGSEKTRLLSQVLPSSSSGSRRPNVELFVRSKGKCSEDIDSLDMIVSVTFYCEPGTCLEGPGHKDMFIEYYPPFVLRRVVIKPCEFNIKIHLRDNSFHFVKRRFDLVKYGDESVDVPISVGRIRPEIPQSPLPSQKFYVEFDLLVPYPYNLEKSSSPQAIAEFIGNVSARPCQYVGYYLEQPMEGLSKNEELLYHLSWKLALQSVPQASDRTVLPHVLRLKSPAFKGIAGLDALSSVLNAIESAISQLKVIRRPGIRIGIDVVHFDDVQMKNITQQYFKYYDAIEDLVKVYECNTPTVPYKEDERERVHINMVDIRRQRKQARHVYGLVGNYLGDCEGIFQLLDNANSINEMVEFACPVSNRSYRYTMSKIESRGHLEFRFEMPELQFHPMSCIISVLLRFVSRAAVLPAPKIFSKCGKGRTLAKRKEKFFKWLVRDRYLEDYFHVIPVPVINGVRPDISDISHSLREKVMISTSSPPPPELKPSFSSIRTSNESFAYDNDYLDN